MESNSACNHSRDWRPYATDGLEDSGRQNDENLARDSGFPVLRDIFSSFCHPESSSSPVA